MSQYLPSVIFSGFRSSQRKYIGIFLFLILLSIPNYISAGCNYDLPLLKELPDHNITNCIHSKEFMSNGENGYLNTTGCINFHRLNQSNLPNRIAVVFADMSHYVRSKIEVSVFSDNYMGHITLILAYKFEEYALRSHNNGTLSPINFIHKAHSRPHTYEIDLSHLKAYRANNSTLKHRIFVKEGDIVKLLPIESFEMVDIIYYNGSLLDHLKYNYHSSQTIKMVPVVFNSLLAEKEYFLTEPNFTNEVDTFVVNHVYWEEQASGRFIRQLSTVKFIKINFTSENWVKLSKNVINVAKLKNFTGCSLVPDDGTFNSTVSMLYQFADDRQNTEYITLKPDSYVKGRSPRPIYWVNHDDTSDVRIVVKNASIFVPNEYLPIVVFFSKTRNYSVTLDMIFKPSRFHFITNSPTVIEGDSSLVNVEFYPNLNDESQFAKLVKEQYGLKKEFLVMYNSIVKSGPHKTLTIVLSRNMYDVPDLWDNISTTCDEANHLMKVEFKLHVLDYVHAQLNKQFGLNSTNLRVYLEGCSEFLDKGFIYSKWTIPVKLNTKVAPGKNQCLKFDLFESQYEYYTEAMVKVEYKGSSNHGNALLANYKLPKKCVFKRSLNPKIYIFKTKKYFPEYDIAKDGPFYWNDDIYVSIESGKNIVVTDCYFKDDGSPDLEPSKFYILNKGCHSEGLYDNDSPPRSRLTYYSPDVAARKVQFKLQIRDPLFSLRKGRLYCKYSFSKKTQSKLCGSTLKFQGSYLVNSKNIAIQLSSKNSGMCSTSLERSISSSGIPSQWVAFITVAAFLMGLSVSLSICCMKGKMKLRSCSTPANSTYCTPNNSMTQRFGFPMRSDNPSPGNISDRSNLQSANTSLLSPTTNSSVSAAKLSNALKLNTCRCLECSSGSTPCSQKPLCHLV